MRVSYGHIPATGRSSFWTSLKQNEPPLEGCKSIIFQYFIQTPDREITNFIQALNEPHKTLQAISRTLRLARHFCITTERDVLGTFL